MARFVFRAQAALDLRRRRYDAEQQACAGARLAVERAERDAREAEARVAAAQQDAMRADGDGDGREWHRNWISGCRHHLGQQHRRLDGRREELTDAERRVLDARRALRALERLKERALAAHLERERLDEQKALDWLGTIQYALRAGERGSEDS